MLETNIFGVITEKQTSFIGSFTNYVIKSENLTYEHYQLYRPKNYFVLSSLLISL